ncbi:MAG: hypothetical protein JAY74_00195 [Candidatus Thiodiazotropha taylori]|nr:hypothetical protein [Candidatus Thiodiazotropha taylori]
MKDRQGDLFTAPGFRIPPYFFCRNNKPLTILISCGERKTNVASKASALYTSHRFKTAIKLSEQLGADYFIISGKYGLVDPNSILEPYDYNLDLTDEKKRLSWGSNVAKELIKQGVEGNVCIFGNKNYSDPLLKQFLKGESSIKVYAPLDSIAEAQHESWLEQALSASYRIRDLEALYNEIRKQRVAGKTFLLKNLSKQKLPNKGVYIFLDPEEKNTFDGSSRIVRVGTHAVSHNSKSTLRNRLRNHLGNENGAGNHRGSIFRLHVGRALIERDGLQQQYTSWGEGQHAAAKIRSKELSHELNVSQYIGNLEVFIFDIDDVSSKHSMRASVESQLIALYSENLIPIESASKQWLGNWSPMKLIKQSLLWNLKDVGRVYDPNGRGSVLSVIHKGQDY